MFGEREAESRLRHRRLALLFQVGVERHAEQLLDDVRAGVVNGVAIQPDREWVGSGLKLAATRLGRSPAW